MVGPQISRCVCHCMFTYRDNERGDESPADFEEERRREAQHHLHVFEVVPVACKRTQGYTGRPGNDVLISSVVV